MFRELIDRIRRLDLTQRRVNSKQPDIMREQDSTASLILTLGEDVRRCHAALLGEIDQGDVDEKGNVAFDDFHARQLIRALFAYIEGITFSVKIKAATKCLDDNVEISPPERYLAGEVGYDLNEKGEIVERPAHLRLAPNIRFAFSLFERAHNLPPQFDASAEWWSCLQASIRVRDRLTHPKLPRDLEVSGEEIVKALRAQTGFDDLCHKYLELIEP
jgi:hypothetical protein